MKRNLILTLSLATVLNAQANIRFNDSWSFCLDAPEQAVDSAYDDSKWRKLDLPHDWSIEGEFNADHPAGADGGYLPTGKGIYRKTFKVGKLEGDYQALYFEGVYMNSRVYVNGHLAGGHPYGYSSFEVNITPYIHANATNVIAVDVDNSQQKNCRWYSGSGIYRNVWWIDRDSQRLNDRWKAFVRTEAIYGVSSDGTRADSALIHVSYEGKLDEYRTLTNVQLWSPEHPQITIVEVGDLKIESGIRTVEYSAEKGLILNGKPYILNGGCLHHDNGCLGAAAYEQAEWRKVMLMKRAGFNAARTSHNAPSETFLTACDHLGLLVIDEAFDGLRDEKNTFDYHTLIDQWWEEDVKALVLRDRNHPSVFCWSSGNEVIERKKIEIVTTTRKIVQLMHKLDPTRPVTQALASWDDDWEIYDPLAAELDITGYNYLLNKTEEDHKRVPKRVMMQTESFPRDAFQCWETVVRCPYLIGDFVWTSLDYVGESGIGLWHYPGENQGEHYQGDHFPYHGAYCGDIDLTGWRKPISHYRQIMWQKTLNGTDGMALAVREPDEYIGKIKETSWSVWPTWESWNWPGHEGKPIDVEVYSTYPKVRLYLNNQLVGERKTSQATQFKAVFNLPYQAGSLRAVPLSAEGNELTEASQIIATAGAPSRLRMSVERCPEGIQDISFVIIEVLDAQGRVVPDAEIPLTLQVTGRGSLLAVANANLKDCDRYTDATHKTWKGRAMAVVRHQGNPSGAQLKVSGQGVKTQRVKL